MNGEFEFSMDFAWYSSASGIAFNRGSVELWDCWVLNGKGRLDGGWLMIDAEVIIVGMVVCL